MRDPESPYTGEESGGGLPTPRSFWILVSSVEMLGATAFFTGEADTMVLRREAARVIPVFSFYEEAELFLWMGGFGRGWRVVEVSSLTLAEMLRGLYSRVDEVALDPIPEVQARSFMELVTVGRESFLNSISGNDSGPKLA
ncbi:hypothetical protein [Rubrobacter indicoceani]|uniref:hypothetical protein n=1 Tax=Rubrobacter indicoceani TaxID=2051957 RepID=UPI000E5C281D|nr:hypothetical protein [Rubrobacter indicoceani]